MSETMKLLEALTDALGFEVEKCFTDQIEIEIPAGEGMHILTYKIETIDLVCINRLYKRGKNGSYFKIIREAESYYKLTLKELDNGS